MSRAELERQVDELAEAHSGKAFADAVRRFSETLGAEEQEELKAVLLERARLLEDAVEERFEARGWFRRMWREPGGAPKPRRK
jgi:hypothetical protein